MVKNSNDLLIELSKDSKDKQYVFDNAVSITSTNPYLVCDFSEYVSLVDDIDIMKILEDGIINFDDIVHIYEFMFLMVDMGIKNFNLPRFEKLIKDSNNPKLMAYTLEFVPGVDKLSMLNSLYATKNIKYIEKLSDSESCLDAHNLPGYRQALNVAKKNIYFPPCLLKFGTKDIGKLIPMVINSKDIYLLNELADYLEYLKVYLGFNYDLSMIEKAHLSYANDEPLYLYEYAASIASSNKEIYTSKVIKKEMPKYMYYMYEYVDGTNKSVLADAIHKTGNEKYISKIKKLG